MTKREPRVEGADLTAHLDALPGWTADGNWITREYQTDGWRTTMLVVGAIAFVAEAANHHPDLGVRWGKVVVRLQTHSAGGVTQKDLELAHRIETTVMWRPEGGFPGLEGQSDGWITS